MRIFSSLWACVGGSAAVEMALVTPLLLTLLFGSFELGNYFLDNHVVTKAVRDGARFASRSVPLKDSCNDTISNDSTAVTNAKAEAQNVTIYGQLTVGTPRLPGWTNGVTVEFSCKTTGTPEGIYSGMSGGAPVVVVTAIVPYHSLFSSVGLSNTSLSISAQSEVPVMGI